MTEGFMFYDISQVYQMVNTISKVYPDRIVIRSYVDSFSMRIAGFESQTPVVCRIMKTTSEGSSEVDIERALRRTKTTISDIVLSNKFDSFVTFTFDKDRNDIDRCKRKMSQWLQSQQKLHKFSYLIVPEFHKDGKSIHFHALFSGYRGRLVSSCRETPMSPTTGKRMRYCNLNHEHKPIKSKSGKILYNLKSYRGGYSTLAKIDHIGKVSSYVRKYITKDMPKFPGAKRYWCSLGLKRPVILYNCADLFLHNPFYEKKVTYKADNFVVHQIDDIMLKQYNYTRSKEWLNPLTTLKLSEMLPHSSSPVKQLTSKQVNSLIGTVLESNLHQTTLL